MTTAAIEYEAIRRLIQCQRLIRLARNPSQARWVKDACERVGLRPGDKVVEVGCGPLGALPALAEVVGPSGTVVGLDRRPDVLQVAGQILHQQGLTQVKLLQADVNSTPTSDLCSVGPYDTAYCRLVLINQADPLITLRQMAALVRPGGHVIIHDLLDDLAYPIFDPPVPGFTQFLHLFQQSMLLQGKSPDVARRLASLAQEAGLREIGQRELINTDPSDAGEFIQEQGLGMLLVFKQSLLSFGLATSDEIDDITRELKAAAKQTYRQFASWVFIESILQVPPARAIDRE